MFSSLTFQGIVVVVSSQLQCNYSVSLVILVVNILILSVSVLFEIRNKLFFYFFNFLYVYNFWQVDFCDFSRLFFFLSLILASSSPGYIQKASLGYYDGFELEFIFFVEIFAASSTFRFQYNIYNIRLTNIDLE